MEKQGINKKDKIVKLSFELKKKTILIVNFSFKVNKL